MAEVLSFPAPRAQGMTYLQRQLSALLEHKGADAELIDFATAQMTEIYADISAREHYNFDVRLPSGISNEDSAQLEADINAGLEGIRKDNHALTLELLARLFLANVRLFQHERAQ